MKGYRLALITNGETKLQNSKIDRFKLRTYFELILIEQEIRIGKPDLYPYLLALKKMNLKPQEVYMVGDNLKLDIQPPQQIGITTIWHDYKNNGIKKETDIKPDIIINEISQILKYI